MAAEAKEYLDKTVKESLYKVSLDITEGSTTASAELLETSPSNGDSQNVIIIMSNFLLDLSRLYPDIESSIASELLRRVKSKLEDPRKQEGSASAVKSHCQVRPGSESSFACLVHASVVYFRALPQLRPSILRHGLIGMMTHCVRNCTVRGGKDAALDWPSWLAPGS